MPDTITTISNDRMQQFCAVIVRQVQSSLIEREADILTAWHENISEANDNEKNFPPLKLNIGATVDLEAGTIETAVSFTVKYTSKIREGIPDPDQQVLPL
jgi:hypothetical protein